MLCEFQLTICSYLVYISVDVECPENNRELTVWQVDYHPVVVNNLFYKAYMIMFPIEIRWLLDSKDVGDGEVPFKACLVGPQCIRICVPSLSYLLQHDHKETNPFVGAGAAIMMDDVCHKIASDANRKWKYYSMSWFGWIMKLLAQVLSMMVQATMKSST